MTKQERRRCSTSRKRRDRLSKADEAAMQAYCEDYKAFLDRSKTERECVVSAVELAEQAGFRALQPAWPCSAGDKVYSINRGKSIMLAVIGSKSLAEGANIGAAHTDSPRLDSSPTPLYEDAELAYFKTHHYGGIRKYQWVTVPLELHGSRPRATAARSTSRSAQTPTTRSSSSTTFCRTLAASRAKSPSTRPSRPNRSTSSSAAAARRRWPDRVKLAVLRICTRNTASRRRTSSPPSSKPSRPARRATSALTAA